LKSEQFSKLNKNTNYEKKEKEKKEKENLNLNIIHFLALYKQPPNRRKEIAKEMATPYVGLAH
jgi:hypothetical protein